MSDKKQKAVPPHPPKTVTVPGRVEWPNAGGPEEQHALIPGPDRWHDPVVDPTPDPND